MSEPKDDATYIYPEPEQKWIMENGRSYPHQAPLTEEDLEGLLRLAANLNRIGGSIPSNEAGLGSLAIGRLVAEVRRLRAILDSPPIIYGTPEYREPRLSIPGKVERVWVNGAPFVKVPG